MNARLTKRNERGVAYMALTDSLPKEKTRIQGSKEVLEGIYAMMQKLAHYEDKEESEEQAVLCGVCGYEQCRCGD